MKRPKYSKSKSIEKTEIALLHQLFADADILTDLTHGDDDFPTIDGYLHLLNKKRETIGQMLQVQVKPVAYRKGPSPTSSVKMQLLAHAFESSTPVLVLGVDVRQSVAYWLYLSPESVHSTLSNPKGHKTITVNFPKKNIIKNGDLNYCEEWKRICLHHRNESNDKIMAKFIRRQSRKNIKEQVSSDSLETLRNFIVYRTNNGEYPFFEYAVSLAKDIRNSDENSKLAYIEILERVYYYRTKDVLQILLTLVSDDEEAVSSKAKKILLEVSQFNFHVLNSAGYGPHRQLMDAVTTFATHDGKRVKSFIRELLQNVLNNSFGGASHPDQNSMVFHQGPLGWTPFLQKIRLDAIKQLFILFDEADTVLEKLEVLSVLFHGFKPSSDKVTDKDAHEKYVSMVNKEIAYAIKQYRKIVVPRQGAISSDYPVVYEIEHQIAWLKTWKYKVPGSKSFLGALSTTNSNYGFYRTIYGNEFDLNPDEDIHEAGNRKEKKIHDYFVAIKNENVDKWRDRLNTVAGFAEKQIATKNYGSFIHFLEFLCRIGKEKPEIADQMLDVTFDNRDALYLFSGKFLFGLRQSSTTLWDKYVKRIEENQSVELTNEIIISFTFIPYTDIQNAVRNEDLDLLTKISLRKDGFSFLAGREEDGFLYNCMKTILYLYQVNPQKSRSLIIELLKAFPTKASLFCQALNLAIGGRAPLMALDDWSAEELKTLANLLVEIDQLGHFQEVILLKLGQQNFDLMISVFDMRIARASKNRAASSTHEVKPFSYTAIPHHFYLKELGEYIRGHQQYKDVLDRWINSITDEYTVESTGLSRLIEFIENGNFKKTLQELIATGKKETLKKVLALFPIIDAPDFNLCFQIIETTDDAEILAGVEQKMRNVGAVISNTRDFDLLGTELKMVKERLEREGITHSSQKVRDFSVQMISKIEKEISEHNRIDLRDLKGDMEDI